MSTKISAQVVADSLSPQGDRLTSLLITFPRIILAEVNTHRMLSKNTSSSRAIPFKKMVESVENDPFIPIAWQKPHKGMQGTEYYDHTLTEEVGELDYKNLPRRWLRARDTAVSMAKIMVDERGNMPITKQLANRLLEPFMWTTMLITGSKEGWDNFFKLRCPQYVSPVDIHFKHKSKKDVIAAHSNPINLEKFKNFTDLEWLKINKGQAEIHMMALAEAIYDAMNESKPTQLKSGEWHIPFEDKLNKEKISELEDNFNHSDLDQWEIPVKISTAMAARTSYTVVGDEKEINYQRMIELHDRLIAQNPPHSSPMEHCAKAMSDEEYESFRKGKHEVTLMDNTENQYWFIEDDSGEKGWCRNFKGFIQYRHLIENY